MAGVDAVADHPHSHGWQCAASVATGYQLQPGPKERWKTIVFPVQDQKFEVRALKRMPGRWELVQSNDPRKTLPCQGDFDGDGLLRCGNGDQFEMNRTTLTFTSHLIGETPGQLTAATSTGQCQPLPPA